MTPIKFRAWDKVTETTFVFTFEDIQEGRVEITDDYIVLDIILHDKPELLKGGE